MTGMRFVGRDRELSELEGLVARSLERTSPTAAMVTGLPGSGKSRLLEEIFERARLPVLRITGYEPEQAVPLTATRDLLRELSRVPQAGARLEAAAFGDQAWGRSAIPLRLFEAASRCLVELAPAIIAIDDLQWVDELSAALVTYLARAGRADGVPMAVIAAGRPSSRTGAVRDALAGILDDGELLELELAPLAEDAGIALVKTLAPRAGTDDARRIWQRAAGSPFWIEALAVVDDAADASISRRFSQLSNEGAAMVRAIAVVGRPARRDELAAMLDWTLEQTAAAIRELSARGLAVERPSGVEAAHDLIREAAQRELPEASARVLHARLARHLQVAADAEARTLREALDHAVAGREPALPIALRIARSAQRRLVGITGLTELARVAEGADWSDPARIELEVALAELSTELGDRAVELERWVRVADHAAGSTRARSLHAAAKAAYSLGRREASARLIAKARAGHPYDLALEIALDAQESEILRWLAHRLPEARRLTARAVQAAESALQAARDQQSPPDPRLRSAAVEALNAAYDLALQEGHEQEQIALAERLVELAQSELEQMEARLLLASAYRYAGRMEDAESTARQIHELAEQRLYPGVMVTARHHLARGLYALGRVEEAERAATSAEQLSARTGEAGRFLPATRDVRPGIGVSRGDWRAGIAQLRADIEREPDPHYQLGIHQEIATWLARLGGPSAAGDVRDRIAAAQACMDRVGCPRCGRELTLRSAEALARIGDLDRARDMLATSAAAEARRSYEGRIFLGQALGALRVAVGPPQRAASALARLSDRLTAGGDRREALWADLDRAQALASFDREAAVKVYQSVVERAANGGVLTDLQVARQRLRDLGVRIAPPRPRLGPLGISRRELEVARLAASGASNPEIAATLFLSRKTVERHISAALLKTGARNRTQLASRLASEMRELPDTDT